MNNESVKERGAELQAELKRSLLRSVPRLLTQLDRDPDSPTFGCFDRDFWHYRMRDFSSIVLQQGAVVLETLHGFDDPENFLYNEPKVISWVDAAMIFWAGQQLRSGSFNEYYPAEEGFPPTAFSLFAVTLIFQKRGFPIAAPPVLSAIQRAVDWLLTTHERLAVNQEATALTALALATKIPGVNLEQSRLDSRLDDFFAAQSSEGWFPEYGGADTGYLSVTVDALAVYFDLTGDARAAVAMDKALEYISSLISISGSLPVMTNSRNTDYIAPYGLIRLAASSPLARNVVVTLLSATASPAHFLNATDDRYLCHYIYQSFFRGIEQLARMTAEEEALPCEKGLEMFYPLAGVHILHIPGGRSIYTAAGKGGVYYLYSPKGIVLADYGWRKKVPDGRVALTHWQHPENRTVYRQKEGSIEIETSGAVSIHGWPESTPLRHFVLRTLSYFCGNRLIALLKRQMIFKAESYGITYSRKILLTDNGIFCTDIFRGSGIRDFEPVPAPAYSLRHVASAGNFSREELSGAASIRRVFTRTGGSLTISSSIVFAEIEG